jgi:hypothetical protein
MQRMQSTQRNQSPVRRVEYTGRRYLTPQEATRHFATMHSVTEDDGEKTGFQIRNGGPLPPPDMEKVMIGRSSLPLEDRD